MQLNEVHFGVMRDILAGHELEGVRERHGLSKHEFATLRRDEDFRSEMARMREEIFQEVREGVTQKLVNTVPKALDRIIDISEKAENEKVKLAANESLLDRAGFGVQQKSQATLSLVLTPDALRYIGNVLKELDDRSKGQAGAIEAEFTPALPG